MGFVDKVKIFVRAGSGGNGRVSFRRERFIEFGGPDGGNGGRGGDVVLIASNAIESLAHLEFKPHIIAQNGELGGKQRKTGKAGASAETLVPVGTRVFDVLRDEPVCELNMHDEMFLLAKGGNGGAGNFCFKSSTVRTPSMAVDGQPGEEGEYILDFCIGATAALIGLPGSGKTRLFNMITGRQSQTKVAYNFSTRTPVIGNLKHDYKTANILDLPSLIAGSVSQGKGLGGEFLRHAERCKLLILVVNADDAESELNILRSELHDYGLAGKKMLVVTFDPCEIDLPHLCVEKPEDVEKLRAILFAS